MTVYLDDELIDVITDNLHSALDGAAKHLAVSGRLVVEVRLDGRELVGDVLEKNLHRELNDAELRLYSADPRQLALTILEESRTELETAGQAQTRAADLFQEGQEDKALREISSAMAKWIKMQQAVGQSVKILGLPLDQIMIHEQRSIDLIDQLADRLKQLRDLLAARDMIGIADTLAYEWPESVDQWRDLLQELLNHARFGNEINPNDPHT